MAQAKDDWLKPNPFTTYRDPKTGRWIVVMSNPQKPTNKIA